MHLGGIAGILAEYGMTHSREIKSGEGGGMLKKAEGSVSLRCPIRIAEEFWSLHICGLELGGALSKNNGI